MFITSDITLIVVGFVITIVLSLVALMLAPLGEVGIGVFILGAVVGIVFLLCGESGKATNDINEAKSINEDEFYSTIKEVSGTDQLNTETMDVGKEDIDGLKNSEYVELLGTKDNKDIKLRVSFDSEEEEMNIKILENKSEDEVLDEYNYDLVQNNTKN